MKPFSVRFDLRKPQGNDKALVSKRENKRFYIILTVKIKREKKKLHQPLFSFRGPNWAASV